jgi:hypothetical protein
MVFIDQLVVPRPFEGLNRVRESSTLKLVGAYETNYA